MTSNPRAPELNKIHPLESLLYAFEFASELETGESLSGTPTVTELDTGDLTIGSPSISGSQVQVRIAAANASENTLYYLECVCGTDQSNTRVCTGRLQVTRREGDTP